MQKTKGVFPRFLIAMAASGLVFTGSAAANDEPAVEDAPLKATSSAPFKITSKILTRAIDSDFRQGWLQAEFHTKKGRGFEYSRSLAVSADKKIIFSIQGPFIKKRTPGIVFEIRF